MPPGQSTKSQWREVTGAVTSQAYRCFGQTCQGQRAHPGGEPGLSLGQRPSGALAEFQSEPFKLMAGARTGISLPWWLRWERICLQCKTPRFNPWVRKSPWRRAWQTTPVLSPGESHGQGSLAGCSAWGRTESDTMNY